MMFKLKQHLNPSLEEYKHYANIVHYAITISRNIAVRFEVILV